MDVRAWNDLEELLARLVLEEAFELEDALVRIAALHPDENAEVLLLAGITVQSDLLLILGIEDQAALATPLEPHAVLLGEHPAVTHWVEPAEDGELVFVEQRCEMVYDTTTTPAGYDVTYELDGQQAIVRMDHHPGDRIPIENGDLLTVASNKS